MLKKTVLFGKLGEQVIKVPVQEKKLPFQGDVSRNKRTFWVNKGRVAIYPWKKSVWYTDASEYQLGAVDDGSGSDF
ncbi:hypothetical protein BpHYR1_007518 [Brachionus plicatilis]|uniref:Uncharacterized protein n=1 Tax=Brachionus plicatilis TaxID=10195 RepID=A0A3M7QPT7_BRAPC|nr:hypothetical protein BpHYR1_007518 [Brachionus plicatilis]